MRQNKTFSSAGQIILPSLFTKGGELEFELKPAILTVDHPSVDFVHSSVVTCSVRWMLIQHLHRQAEHDHEPPYATPN